MGEEDLHGDEIQAVRKFRMTSLHWVGVVIIAALIAFLVGLVPMWISKYRVSNQLDTTQKELRVSQWQNLLASAAIDSRRGEYEPARQAASRLFTEVSAELLKTSDSAFTPEQAERAKAALASRDEIITLLARNDPASADKLTMMQIAFRAAVAAPAAASK